MTRGDAKRRLGALEVTAIAAQGRIGVAPVAVEAEPAGSSPPDERQPSREFLSLIPHEFARRHLILSAGVEINEFILDVELATQAGCSGFLCGRAIWQDAVKRYPDVSGMEEFLEIKYLCMGGL